MNPTSRVDRKDSNANGMLIGLVAGGAGGVAVSGAMCGRYMKCDALQLLVGLPIGAGLGLLAGFAIDVSHWRSQTLFERPQSAGLTFVPILDSRSAGGSLVVRWR